LTGHRMKPKRTLVAVVDMITSIGGVQRVMAEVLPRLGDEFDVVVIDPYNHPEYAEMMRNVGLKTVCLGSAPERRYIGGANPAQRVINISRRAPWLFLTIARLRRWVRRNRPDAIYFNQLPVVRVFSRAMPRRGPALVYHAHGFRSAEHIGRGTARLVSGRFACVLAVSKITAGFLIEAGVDPHKVGVVYNGVDVESIQRQAGSDGPPLPSRQPDSVVFAHVAVVDRRKKAQHLPIEALGRLPVSPRCSLWICGDVPAGGDKSYLEYLHGRVEALNLNDRVQFLGWRTDVPRVISQCDVCVLPSLDHSESFGMVLAEAMALEKPCIGSDFGGIPEVIEDGVTGLVCRPNLETLTAAMGRLAQSEDLRRSMGQAGRRRVEEVFSVSGQAAQIAALLRSATESTRS
jgi:glycosyltransferase involved in cell wall biosynthesis